MNIKYSFIVAVVLIVLKFDMNLFAQIPSTMNYQGFLTDNNEVPIDGSRNLKFEIYSVLIGGSVLWSESHFGVAISGGSFSVVLGSSSPLPQDIFESQQRFLQVEVNSTILSPRQPFTSSAYSFSSRIAPNSISSSELQNNSVGSSEIMPGSVGSAEHAANISLSPGGRLDIGNSSGSSRGLFTYNVGGGGFFSIDANDGDEAVRITTTVNNPSGYLEVNRDDGSRVIVATTTTTQGGFFQTYANDGSALATLSTIGTPSAGYFAVRNDLGNVTFDIDGRTGNVATYSSQGFKMKIEHPSDLTKEFHYTSIAGPESAIYHRGTEKLRNGKATIFLPQYFSLIASGDRLTVHITPLSTDSRGLAVITKSVSEIEIAELQDGMGNYSFDFIVYAQKIESEGYQIVHSKSVNNSDTGTINASGSSLGK